ncbi:hypothetical protein QTP88_006153 [Uroleucon formosanum]
MSMLSPFPRYRIFQVGVLETCSANQPEELGWAMKKVFGGRFILWEQKFTLGKKKNFMVVDYNPIILSISDSITTLNPPNVRKRINWKKYEKYLSEDLSKINNIKSTKDINKEISTLTKTIQSDLEINSYTIKHSPRKE